MRAVLGAVMLTLAVLSAAGAAIVTAAPASASVLVNADSGTIRLGQSLQLGVFDQPGRGGPSGYWAGVWSYPAHRWISVRSGHAVAGSWKYWYVRPPKRGEYATVYRADGTTATFYTAVR